MSHTTTVHLDNREQQDKLAVIARELGLLVSRGIGAGRVGSVSELCRAIAEGRVIVSKVEQDEPDEKV